MQRFVMIHKTDGIFVGCGLGFAFFTLCDSVGQSTVCTFDTVEAGRSFVESLGSPWAADDIRFEAVQASGTHATIEELKAAGLSSLLGDMEADALRYATPAGQA